MLEKKSKKIIKNIIEILGVIVIAVLINKFIIFTVYISSESMVPTLNSGDRLLVTRVYNPNNLKRGDVVIFKSNELNEILVKRLIGLPGYEIEFKGKSVYPNGKRLDEAYVKNSVEFEGKYNVPSNKYFFDEQDTAGRHYFMSSKYLHVPLSSEKYEEQDNKYFFQVITGIIQMIRDFRRIRI
ncbi:signal peptidase I [Clostridium sardiniense]|uniref:signal peptidase I n=1 Tax=Clostridium sardiniense TaxID=29369 RepID=UPI00195DC6DD|nr:signal peptidase I [Clostridium sardiniense]MBM7835585.1 signal peptidase I [Clostridium sardiniense]